MAGAGRIGQLLADRPRLTDHVRADALLAGVGEHVVAVHGIALAWSMQPGRGDFYLVGGAAIALASDARRTTRDVDAVFDRKLLVYEVAAQRGLSPVALAALIGLSSARDVFNLAVRLVGPSAFPPAPAFSSRRCSAT